MHESINTLAIHTLASKPDRSYFHFAHCVVSRFISFRLYKKQHFISFGLYKNKCQQMASNGAMPGARVAREKVVVEAASDSEDEYRHQNGVTFGHYPGAEHLAIRNDRETVVMVPPRLDDVAPEYISENDDGTVTIELDCMDKATRIRISTLMSMYADDATHFAKCMGFSAAIADLLKQPKENVALELTRAQVQSWDWNGDTLKVGKLSYDHARLLKGLHKAVNEDRVFQGLLVGVRMSKLKGWRHQIRLCKQGRQLYADFQQIMPGKSFQEIEAKMSAELGHLETKPQVDDRVRALIEEYREEKRKLARASNIAAAPTTTTVSAVSTAVVAAAAEALTRAGQETNAAVPATVTDGSSNSEGEPTTPPVIASRKSSRATKRPQLLAEEQGEAAAKEPATKKPKVASLAPSFTKRATQPTTTRPTSGMVPPKLLKNGDGKDIGYSVPSTEWVTASMNKLVLLKNLSNYCAFEGIRGPRAVLDTLLDELMGGGADYNRTFVILIGWTILDQMGEPDEAFIRIIAALKASGLLTPESIAASNAKRLREIISPHDKTLNTGWMVKLCKILMEDYDSIVPSTAEALVALGVKEITHSVASSVIQDAFGYFYGPAIDQFYGCCMVVALELIDLEEHHFDKSNIDPDTVQPTYVRESLLSWLPQQEWKDFSKVMVSIAQMLVEAPEGQANSIRKIIRKRFGPADRNFLLGMADSIVEYFANVSD